MKEDKILRFFGLVGIALLVFTSVYLILKLLGFIHSLELEEVLTAAVFGSLFYVGYSYKAIEEIGEIKKEIKLVKNKVDKIEKPCLVKVVRGLNRAEHQAKESAQRADSLKALLD